MFTERDTRNSSWSTSSTGQKPNNHTCSVEHHDAAGHHHTLGDANAADYGPSDATTDHGHRYAAGGRQPPSIHGHSG
jgi:hypothetical protein